MKRNDFSKQKYYLSELKNHTKDFTVSFKKRYDIFPWKVLSKVKREYYNEEVHVSSTKFTVKSLIKEVDKIQKSLSSRLKPSYYNFILKSYIKDVKDLDEKDLKKIYQNYKAELDKEFKSCKLDLEFSISALKSLTKFIKEKSETVSESVKSNIDTLIFDFGGVLVKSVMLKGRRDLFGDVKISDADLDTFIQSYFSHGGEFENCSYEDAKILYKTYLPERLHKYIDKVFDVVFGTTVPYDYSVPLIQSLKEAGYKLYYLSNWNKTGFELCEKNGSFPFKKYFDGGIVSYEVGLLKPDKKIYELLIEKYQINPKTAMFFDDKKENVEAAKKVGLNTTLFTQKTVKEIMDMTKFVKESVDVIPKNDNTKAVMSFLKKYGITNISMIVFTSEGSSSVDFFGDFKGTRYSAVELADLVDTSKIDFGKTRIIDIIRKDKKYNKDKLNIVYIKADGSIMFKYDIKGAKTNKYKTDWKNSNKTKNNQNNKIIKEKSEEMRLEFLDENNNVCDVNDMLLEMAIDLYFEDDESSFEKITTEGMNSDITKMRKNYKKNYKEIIKSFKNCMKKNDFNGARKSLDEAEKIVKEFSSALEKCESDEIPSLIIGYFLQSLKDMLQITLIALIPIVGIPAASITSMVKTIEQIITSVRNVIKKTSKKEQVTLSDFNIYKNQAIRVADKLAAQINSCRGKVDEKEKKIKEIEKEQKKKINVKESAEYKEKKLSIYESCQKGEITLEERESLLNELDKETVLQECENNEEASISNREKCKAVIEALYEKCSNGEITLEEREYLIDKAQSKFLESGEQQPSGNEKDGIDPKQEQEAKKLEAELKKAGEQPVGNK